MGYSFTDLHLDAPVDPGLVDGLPASLGVALPEDYIDFLKMHNGGEGFIGDNYIIFWKAEELADFNREYEVEQYAPGILLFASSGGGEGYGFDTQSEGMPIVRVPFIGMTRDDAELVAQNLPDLFAKLKTAL
ncbi:SMI1/KNR4 family protein [Pararhizobium gei]|uniref:SMI1/KNR4 family protein n=1 Tax=Pararhizobium gei TaxID=1395951 RepID=UPI0023DA27A6|nr:SMI1/KNR4 family protein [Rhizobium gei]